MQDINDKIELIDDFFWPRKGGASCREITLIRHDTPHRISSYCENKNVIISAGANVGFYIKKYAGIFKKVYAIEPDLINFNCLDLNVKEENVLKIYGALGNEMKKVGLSIHCDDCGAWKIANGEDVQMHRIDDLKLEELDLIALDVEGFEINVLKGAIETIRKYKPVVSVEANFYTDACEFLEQNNYSKVDVVNGDWVYKSNE
jgi:FkbM family methyltransferase